MTQEEEKIKVLTALMFMQATVFALDECEPIKWFNSRRSKQLVKATIDIIPKEHGEVIKSLWGVEGVQMPQVVQALEDYSKEFGKTDYYKLPEVTALIRAYNAGEFEELFEPTRDEQ